VLGIKRSNHREREVKSDCTIVVERRRIVCIEEVLIVIINQFFILIAFSRPSHFPFSFDGKKFSRENPKREKNNKSELSNVCTPVQN
jgi:hypothetical protein